jgi:hypothetical protein
LACTTGLHRFSVKPKAECEEQRQTKGLGVGVTKTEEQAHAKKSRRGAGWLKNQRAEERADWAEGVNQRGSNQSSMRLADRQRESKA